MGSLLSLSAHHPDVAVVVGDYVDWERTGDALRAAAKEGRWASQFLEKDVGHAYAQGTRCFVNLSDMDMVRFCVAHPDALLYDTLLSTGAPDGTIHLPNKVDAYPSPAVSAEMAAQLCLAYGASQRVVHVLTTEMPLHETLDNLANTKGVSLCVRCCNRKADLLRAAAELAAQPAPVWINVNVDVCAVRDLLAAFAASPGQKPPADGTGTGIGTLPEGASATADAGPRCKLFMDPSYDPNDVLASMDDATRAAMRGRLYTFRVVDRLFRDLDTPEEAVRHTLEIARPGVPPSGVDRRAVAEYFEGFSVALLSYDRVPHGTARYPVSVGYDGGKDGKDDATWGFVRTIRCRP